MIDRFARKAFALTASLGLTLPGIAQAEDLPAYKQAVEETSVGYDQGISCQALYVIIEAQFDEGSEEANSTREIYDSWVEFSKEYYPLDFDLHHDADVNNEADRIFGEVGSLPAELFQTEVDKRLDECEALEDAELIFL